MTPTPTVTDRARSIDLRTRYQQVRAFTESLAAPLSAEDQTVQTMPDVSPTKWHRAHTTWFFETFLLSKFQSDYTVVDPAYGFIFNSYYEAVGPRHARPERGLLSRPGIAEILDYRCRVDEAMGELFADDLAPEVAWLVELGLNHEQQHQELLLMDIKHVLGTNPLRPAYRSSPAATATRPSDAADNWIEHPGGVVTVGRAQEAEGFCFDNECPVHEALLQPFALRSQLVTCGEWLEFLADDGYQRAELWMSDGWGAIHTNDWDAPGYWERGDDGWLVYTLEGLRPVDPAEPVCHVSWYEADAFARWAGYRLPSEPEWETVARPIIEARGDVGGLCDPSVDGLHPWAGAIDDDPEQWTDAVWQWTASSYGPYPGFAPAPGAVGEYNGKFMVNQQALRGGACITPEGHTRATYRNFFYPSARWPFTGVRLAADR